MKNLIIIGAGDWGLEIFAWIHESVQYGKEYTFKGFIDDNNNALTKSIIDNSLLLGSIKDYQIDMNDVFICAIANLQIKEKIINSFSSKSAVFVNAFHKTVCFIGQSDIGKGVVLSPYVVVSNNSVIGDHVGVNLFCSIGHDVKIGDYCQLSAHCDLTGHVELSNSVFLGSRVTIIPNINVVAYSILGAGAVVFRNIKFAGTYVGNPAKKID
jgi:sugar O-acyltransferase (sialic acid O-acetyltransferase NeuD family)